MPVGPASNRVQVTVCDYNYVFDPYVSLSSFAAEEDLSDVILVIDEVHNLVGRGRGYYSPELSSNAARREEATSNMWSMASRLPLAEGCDDASAWTASDHNRRSAVSLRLSAEVSCRSVSAREKASRAAR